MLTGSSATPLSHVDSKWIELQPATFWQRLAGGIIDFALTAIFISALGMLCSTSKHAAVILVVPLALSGFLYSSIGHALYGRTVGKYLVKILVVRLDGSPIGWNEALRRSFVHGVFEVAWMIGLLSAIVSLPVESFHGQGWFALYKSFTPLLPAYVRTTLQVSGYWDWSEFVTMLLNRKRRALHDFIGSTMVIRATQFHNIGHRNQPARTGSQL
jgi:uncharacterized RDD family membrane protein YckC